MKKLLIIISLFVLNKVLGQDPPLKDKFVLVVHGGAGTILKSQLTPEKEMAYKKGLDEALKAGNEILARGGKALDAVEAAVRVMEDNPLFNAGKGAVFTNEGSVELDASIMDGSNQKAGSVAGVTTIRNPISAARAVMDKSPHVMMAGKGAEKFAMLQGLEIVDPSYFFTQDRWNSLLRTRATDSLEQLKKDSILKKSMGWKDYFETPWGIAGKYGTVGAVALDRHGNLAAATSTGGMTNKRYGRIGDAPIIGAGTYANESVAVSGTGWGEFYIRLVLAKSISDLVTIGKMKLSEAASLMVMKKLPALGGDGGVIAVDREGNIATPFCTEGMYRGYITSEGKKEIKIFKE